MGSFAALPWASGRVSSAPRGPGAEEKGGWGAPRAEEDDAEPRHRRFLLRADLC